MSEMRGFKIGSLNINSLVKHIDELRVVMINQPLDILAYWSLMNLNLMTTILITFFLWGEKNKQGGGVYVYLRVSLSFK